jgi:hypothetical protein
MGTVALQLPTATARTQADATNSKPSTRLPEAGAVVISRDRQTVARHAEDGPFATALRQAAHLQCGGDLHLFDK